MCKRYNLRRIRIHFLGLLLGTIVALCYVLGNSGEERPFGGTLRIKAFSDTFKQNFDPAGDAHIFILEQIYDGLVKLDNNLNIVPSLAEYWVISGDGKRYTFYLRKGVKFHHGRELEAKDVKFSLERMVNKETGSLTSQFFTPIVVGAQAYVDGKAAEVAGFKVLDKYIFEIQWKAPYVSGLYLLSMGFCKILPRDLVLSQRSNFFWKPSGTGAFKFAYWLRSPKLEIVGVRLERNKEYFGKQPYVDSLEFSPYFTLDHFLEKEIDITPYFSERLTRTDGFIFEGGVSSLVFLGMSCGIPPLNQQAIRKAISLAIDKKRLAKAAYTLESVPHEIDRFIPEKFPGFFYQEGKGDYDPKKARQILQEEGYSPEQNSLSLILFLNTAQRETHFKFFREMEEQLGAVGIKLRLRWYSSPEDIRSSRQPFLVMVDWHLDIPDPENIIKPLFQSRSKFNWIQYANPDLDRLLKEADMERSWTRRIELFHKMEQILMADIPALPLFANKQRLVTQSYVKGFRIPTLGFNHLDAKEIWLEKREKK
ncbi:MAG: ABC transporter substrate-binding protein [Candidatus Aminicenantales bacterium]